MPWTEQQREAIDSRGENLLVSAAAGSGKTTVLVERVIRLIRDGADINSMLIVTFTRAAAADMRASLLKALEKAAEEIPSLREQADAAQSAGISTIHAFCIDLLRDHFQTAGVDPAFRVADPSQETLLISKALEEAMTSAYGEETDDLIALTEHRRPDEVRALVLSLYAFIQNRPEPFGWLDASLASLERGEDLYSPVLAEGARRCLRDALALSARAELTAGSDPALEPFEKLAREDRERLESFLGLDYESLRAALADPGFRRLPTVREMADDPGRMRFVALRKAMRDRVKLAQKRLPLKLDEAVSDLPALACEMRALRDIAWRLDAAYTRMKEERGILTFGDMEHKTLQALKDDAVYEALRRRYDYVFVDEYQDVSEIQEAIIRRIVRSDNLFCVGDVKQSIYRFRNAEPSLFQDKYARYGRGEGGRLVLLNKNFRSRANILNFTNAVLSHAMRGGDSEILYDQDAYLIHGANCAGEDAPIELTLIQQDGEEDLPDDPDNDAPMTEADLLILDMKEAEAEALVTARRISQLVGTPLWDAGSGTWRTVRYSDCVILTRAVHDVASRMVGVFRREGIPVYADVSGGFLDVMEVRVALALLRLIDNRRLDPEWIAVLRSPVIGVDSRTLSVIRMTGGEDASFADAVNLYSRGDGPHARQIAAFIDQLSRWRSVCHAMPLSRFIFCVMQESGLYAAVGALPGGTQRQANLDVLCDRAAAFEESQAVSLTGFLRAIEEISSGREDMGEAHILGENDDVVRIMTVHKSKGLEFPVVFGVMLGRSWKKHGGRGELRCHPSLGAGMKHIDNRLISRRDTLIALAADEKAAAEATAEELRILYVLLTRAKDRLILSGCVKSASAAAESAMASLDRLLTPSCALDVILPSLIRMPGGNLLAPEAPPDDRLPQVAVSVITRSRLMGREAQAAHSAADAMEEALACPVDDQLVRMYTWQYPHQGDVLLPLKLTASGLSRDLTGPGVIPDMAPRPAFMQETAAALTGAERGTAYHAALQRIDPERLRGLDASAVREEIARQLDGMRHRGALTQAMYDVISVQALAGFFTAGAGKRMLASDEMHREWMFTLSMTARESGLADTDSAILVQGSIDCCFLEDGQWVLLDYKTDGSGDEEALTARYSPQIAIYALALQRITGIAVKESILCLLRSGKELRVDSSPVGIHQS